MGTDIPSPSNEKPHNLRPFELYSLNKNAYHQNKRQYGRKIGKLVKLPDSNPFLTDCNLILAFPKQTFFRKHNKYSFISGAYRFKIEIGYKRNSGVYYRRIKFTQYDFNNNRISIEKYFNIFSHIENEKKMNSVFNFIEGGEKFLWISL